MAVTECDSSGDCQESTRRRAIDLVWTARSGPALENFTYSRTTVGDCESTFTQTLRGRRAPAEGQLGERHVRLRGFISSVDLLVTQVCT